MGDWLPPGPEGGPIGSSKNIIELVITSKYLKSTSKYLEAEDTSTFGGSAAIWGGGRTNPIRGCKPDTHLSHTIQTMMMPVAIMMANVAVADT